MKDYNYKNLRNVGLIGHGATGKTSLTEALLFYTNNTDRLGKVDDGTTVMDYEQEEKKRKISLSTSVASFEVDDIKVNIVDMPGYFDFQGEVAEGMRAVDIATIVVCLVFPNIDGYIISPKVYGKTNNVNALWTIFAVTAGGTLFGIVGIMFSLPIYIALNCTFNFFKEDIYDLLSDRKEDKQ